MNGSSITGRLPPGATATGITTIDILDNDHRLYADNRRTQIDMRFAKVVRFGGTRTHVGIDIFNILNSDAILTYNQTFAPGGAWLAPQSVLTPRFYKLSAQIDF